MSQLNADGNIIGRLGAIALLVALGFGYHRISCDSGMCPVMKTDSCCAGMSHHASAEAPKAETPAAPAAVPAE